MYRKHRGLIVLSLLSFVVFILFAQSQAAQPQNNELASYVAGEDGDRHKKVHRKKRAKSRYYGSDKKETPREKTARTQSRISGKSGQAKESRPS